MRLFLVWLITLVQLGSLGFSQESMREQVGELNGKPIYRDELGNGEADKVGQELLRRIANDLFERFEKENAKELEVTEAEIEQMMTYFEEKRAQEISQTGAAIRKDIEEISVRLQKLQADSPERATLEKKRADLEADLLKPAIDKATARFIISNWKRQRVLYKKYKGGRLLWQQLGIEAYDATRVYFETEEKAGRFKILDPKLRDEFYFYWTKQKHGPFLIDDPERIRTEFLEPEWLAKKVEK